MIKSETPAQVFSCEFCRTVFYRAPLGDCVCFYCDSLTYF